MSACIGWQDGECPVHGQFHGCRYDADEHPSKAHECLCGATAPGNGGRWGAGSSASVHLGCGDDAGYNRHLRKGEPACHACKAAHAAANLRRKADR